MPLVPEPAGILGGPHSVAAYLAYLGIASISELEPIEQEPGDQLAFDLEVLGERAA
jgi:hypothetical protein